jgi:hypothetical protein
MTGSLTINNGYDLNFKAASGSSDTGDLVFFNGSDTEIGRIWINDGNFCIRYSGSDSSKTILHTGNYASSHDNTSQGRRHRIPASYVQGIRYVVQELHKFPDDDTRHGDHISINDSRTDNVHFLSHDIDHIHDLPRTDADVPDQRRQGTITLHHFRDPRRRLYPGIYGHYDYHAFLLWALRGMRKAKAKQSLA